MNKNQINFIFPLFYQINNPASCDTLDGSFSSLPGTDLNLDDLLDLDEVGDLVTTSPLSATDMPANPVCHWGFMSSGKGSREIDSNHCLDLLSISDATRDCNASEKTLTNQTGKLWALGS